MNGSIPVYLDNIFFQSESLKFGNPTAARNTLTDNQYLNNYLIEKLQYTISYNKEKNTPNWVSWVMDGEWPGYKNSSERPESFIEDPDLPLSHFYRVNNSDYKYLNDLLSTHYSEEEYKKLKLFKYSSKLVGALYPEVAYEEPAIFWSARGHLSASNDRNRSLKDMYATFLTTNIVPQDSKANGGIWKALEEHLQNLARLGQHKNNPTTPYKFYIYAGVYGAGGGKIPTVNAR